MVRRAQEEMDNGRLRERVKGRKKEKKERDIERKLKGECMYSQCHSGLQELHSFISVIK